jgi:hypothetical protein
VHISCQKFQKGARLRRCIDVAHSTVVHTEQKIAFPLTYKHEYERREPEIHPFHGHYDLQG